MFTDRQSAGNWPVCMERLYMHPHRFKDHVWYSVRSTCFCWVQIFQQFGYTVFVDGELIQSWEGCSFHPGERCAIIWCEGGLELVQEDVCLGRSITLECCAFLERCCTSTILAPRFDIAPEGLRVVVPQSFFYCVVDVLPFYGSHLSPAFFL